MAKRKRKGDRETKRPGIGGGVRPMWSGTLSFGLVSIPVNVLPAVRTQRVAMRTLAPDGTPLRRQFVCPAENVVVHPEHLIRGYEIEKDQYVLVREDELEALQPEASRDIDLRQFVDVAEIPPRLFERPYFLAPSGASTKAYRLLAAVMEDAGRAGIATFVMRDKEYLVAILAERGILRAETMRFHDEIRSPADIGLPEAETPDAKDRRAMEQAIKARTAKTLDKDLLVDTYRQRLMDVVEKKRRAGQGVVHAEAVAEAGAEAEDDEVESTPDLMAVLQASLQGQGGAAAAGGNGHAPIEGYDDLSAKELSGKLEELDAGVLEQLRDYERRHKDRKTVLSAIERRLRS